MITKIKDIFMMMLCGMLLAVMFMFFAILAIFSSTARWIIDESMHKMADVLSNAEDMRIRKAREAGEA